MWCAAQGYTLLLLHLCKMDYWPFWCKFEILTWVHVKRRSLPGESVCSCYICFEAHYSILWQGELTQGHWCAESICQLWAAHSYWIYKLYRWDSIPTFSVLYSLWKLVILLILQAGSGFCCGCPETNSLARVFRVKSNADLTWCTAILLLHQWKLVQYLWYSGAWGEAFQFCFRCSCSVWDYFLFHRYVL